MKKRKTKTPKAAEPTTAAEALAACGIGPDVQRPETTVEWQVTPAGPDGITYVFTDPGKVFRFLASEWAKFVLGWDQRRTCKLGVEVRRVERERHDSLSPGRKAEE